MIPSDETFICAIETATFCMKRDTWEQKWFYAPVFFIKHILKNDLDFFFISEIAKQDIEKEMASLSQWNYIHKI